MTVIQQGFIVCKDLFKLSGMRPSQVTAPFSHVSQVFKTSKKPEERESHIHKAFDAKDYRRGGCLIIVVEFQVLENKYQTSTKKNLSTMLSIPPSQSRLHSMDSEFMQVKCSGGLQDSSGLMGEIDGL